MTQKTTQTRRRSKPPCPPHIFESGRDRAEHAAPEIGRLTHLSTVILDWNQLTALPPEIGQLTNLEELKLQNNQLTELPPEVGQVASRRTLWLNGNPWKGCLPESWQVQYISFRPARPRHLPSCTD